jgi:hypothetical protein
MVGSEKQIRWAERIKREIVEMVEDELLRQALLHKADDPYVARIRTALKKAADEQEQAKFWIDARPQGRAPVQETFAAMNILRRRVVEILRAK